VIVAAECIARDIAPMRIGEHIGGRPRVHRPVIEACRDYPNGARHERRRPRPPRAMASHIIHLAMASEREPVHQLHFLGREIRVGHTDRIEAELAPPRGDPRCECYEIAIRCQR
jgi:hypothetical protein